MRMHRGLASFILHDHCAMQLLHRLRTEPSFPRAIPNSTCEVSTCNGAAKDLHLFQPIDIEHFLATAFSFIAMVTKMAVAVYAAMAPVLLYQAFGEMEEQSVAMSPCTCSACLLSSPACLCCGCHPEWILSTPCR